MLCVLTLYISGRTYSLNWTLNVRFFEKLFMAILFYSQSFCQKSTERKSPKKYFLYFVLMSGLGLEPWLPNGLRPQHIRIEILKKVSFNIKYFLSVNIKKYNFRWHVRL